jgi:hypothetical protein
VSVGAFPPRGLELPPPPARSGTRGAAVALTRREATLRAAATLCLAGIAMVQAIQLPSLWEQGRQFGLAMAAMVLCIAVAVAPAAASADAARPLWRVVAATAVLVLAGWALPRAVALPDTVGARGDWTSMPAAACAAMAVVSLVLAAAAVGPTRATAGGLAGAAALLLAIGPGVGALIVAVEPGPAGGESAITADVHVHAHLTTGESDIVFRAGRNGNHYLTPVVTRPRPPAIGIALVAAVAFAFVAGAIAQLRRRCALPGPMAGTGRSLA